MKKITLAVQLFDSSIGYGWKNRFRAATAFGDFIKEAWTEELAEFKAQGYDVTVEIDVCRREEEEATTTPLWIIIDNPDLTPSELYFLSKRVEDQLSDDIILFSKFVQESKDEHY